MNALNQARETLEARQPGLFARSIEYVLANEGIMHAEPACFLLLLPEPEAEPGTWRVLFFSGSMRTARRIAKGLPCKNLIWRRDFTGRTSYGERRRPMSDFMRHNT
jgi:hypothetical protein